MIGKTYITVGNWHYIPGPRGLSVYSYDQETAEIKHINTFFPELACGQQTIDQKTGIIYAVNETSDYQQQKGGGGGVYALRIDTEQDVPKLINSIQTYAVDPSYFCLDSNKQYAIVVHHAGPGKITRTVASSDGALSAQVVYNDAPIELIRIREDGSLGEICDMHIFEQSPNVYKHTHPNMHAVCRDPSGELFVVMDPGMDRIYSYKIDRQAEKLVCIGETCVEIGSAPRYCTFHPSQTILYVNSESTSKLYSFHYDVHSGKLEHSCTAPIQCGENSGKRSEAADIVIHPNGKYLYVTDRGADFIAVFALDDEGMPTLLKNVPCGGKNPRGMCLSPDLRFLLVANSDTQNIAVFSIGEGAELYLLRSDIPAVCPANINFITY